MLFRQRVADVMRCNESPLSLLLFLCLLLPFVFFKYLDVMSQTLHSLGTLRKSPVQRKPLANRLKVRILELLIVLYVGSFLAIFRKIESPSEVFCLLQYTSWLSQYFSVDSRGLCSEVMATFGRLEAKLRSGSTGDGFLLHMCTSCRYKRFIFPFRIPVQKHEHSGILQEACSLPCLLERLPTQLSLQQLAGTSCAIPSVPTSDAASRAPALPFCTGGLHFCVQDCLRDVLVAEGLAAVSLRCLCALL